MHASPQSLDAELKRTFGFLAVAIVVLSVIFAVVRYAQAWTDEKDRQQDVMQVSPHPHLLGPTHVRRRITISLASHHGSESNYDESDASSQVLNGVSKSHIDSTRALLEQFDYDYELLERRQMLVAQRWSTAEF